MPIIDQNSTSHRQRSAHRAARGGAATAICALLAAAVLGCSQERSGNGGTSPDEFASGRQLTISPRDASLRVGDTTHFSALSYSASGDTVIESVEWEAIGGSIDADGNFVAESVGVFPISARSISRSDLRDSTTVRVASVAPVSLRLAPTSVELKPGDVVQFTATVHGDTRGDVVTWHASGGVVTATGMFTAGQTVGDFSVVASCSCGAVDSAAVTIASAVARPLAAIRLVLSPHTVELGPHVTQSFVATEILEDGSTRAVAATFAASGGVITADGEYSAGSTPGTYEVIATDAATALADTATIVVNALWVADMETGDLRQWEDNPYQSTPCGGQFNSGPFAETVPSRDVAHSGSWSAKMTIAADDPAVTNGTRMFRWCEPQRNPVLYYSVWYLLPQRYTIGSGGWINLFQYKAVNPANQESDPFFFLGFRNAADGMMHLTLTWWGELPIDGPYPGETGERKWQSPLVLPSGQWVHIEARYSCAGDFSGGIQVWQDGALVFDLDGVRTTYAGSPCQWSVDNYGSRISPSPVTVYFDDAVISRARIGP